MKEDDKLGERIIDGGRNGGVEIGRLKRGNADGFVI